jgi:hypothetical protein
MDRWGRRVRDRNRRTGQQAEQQAYTDRNHNQSVKKFHFHLIKPPPPKQTIDDFIITDTSNIVYVL